MKSRNGEVKKEVGVELKYCEHCGGLWVRERGAGAVNCNRLPAQGSGLAGQSK